jgi:soluble lytic murein transglycosylase
MQLLPETGRRAAREISYPYKGRITLTDPTSNIRLGTFYLGKMYSRFYQHAVPATAAYNAGPLRVERWLPANGAVDARIWIENIPFNETRKYVRRVLASDTIFRWRLTGETQRISGQLKKISVTSDPALVAGY